MARHHWGGRISGCNTLTFRGYRPGENPELKRGCCVQSRKSRTRSGHVSLNDICHSLCRLLLYDGKTGHGALDCVHMRKGTEFLLCLIGCFKQSYLSMPRKLKPTIHSFTKTQCKSLSMGLSQRPKVMVLTANQARCCNVDSHRFSQGKKALFQQAPLGGVRMVGK